MPSRVSFGSLAALADPWIHPPVSAPPCPSSSKRRRCAGTTSGGGRGSCSADVLERPQAASEQCQRLPRRDPEGGAVRDARELGCEAARHSTARSVLLRPCGAGQLLDSSADLEEKRLRMRHGVMV